MSTLLQLKTRIFNRLSQQSGVSVQPYTDNKVTEMIQHKFDVLFDRRFWRDYRITNTYQLDGIIGVVTADLTNVIKRFIDIQYIWIDANLSGSPLPEIDSRSNPTRINLLGFEPYGVPAKRFRIVPVTTTGYVTVRFRTKPPMFVDSDEVPMDDQLIMTGTIYDYLNDEGANPEAAAKYKNMFESRLGQLESLDMKNEKSLYSTESQYVSDWHDA